MQLVPPISMEDQLTCGLMEYGSEESELLETEVEQKVLAKKVLLGDDVTREMVGRLESMFMISEKSGGLDEVRMIQKTAADLMEQPVGRTLVSSLQSILNRCVELEAEYLSATTTAELDALHAEIGVDRAHRSMRKKSGSTRDAHVVKSNYTEYTRNLLAVLHSLQESAPSATTKIQHHEEEDLEVTTTTSSEVSISCGVSLLVIPPSSYIIGMDLGAHGDDPVVKASRLLNIPFIDPTAEPEGLHVQWNTLLTRSIALPSVKPDSMSLEAPHISCNPLQTWVTEAGFEITKDVIRRSHLAKLMDAFPKVRAIAACLDMSEGTHVPVFLNGVHVGYEDVPFMEDGDDDPAVEVPYVVAAQFAEALGARVPTWQEWEMAVRGEEGLKFPWGDQDDLPCIDIDVEEVAGTYYNMLTSYGWLRHSASPLGLVGLCRSGWEWNSCNFDVKDATGGLEEIPTTHVIRSLSDFRVGWQETVPTSARRSFTLPCAAAYGVPHKGIHAAAFRLAFDQNPVQKPPVKLNLTDLVMLLKISHQSPTNTSRITGLLGPPETKVKNPTVHQTEEWHYLTKGCSIEVSTIRGLRVLSVTVYDKDYTLPRSRRSFLGTVNNGKKFPLKIADLGLPAPNRVSGAISYYTVTPEVFSWWSEGRARPPPGRLRVTTSRPWERFAPDLFLSLAVTHPSDHISSLSVTIE